MLVYAISMHYVLFIFRMVYIEPSAVLCKLASFMWGVINGIAILGGVIGRAKRAPHWGVQSRIRVIYICRYVCLSYVKSRGTT